MIQASKTRTTTIGIQGENKARVIAFDVSDILAEFPGASFTLIHQRSGDSSAYPVGSTELHGTMLLWTVTSADTAIAGSSYCELIATVDDVVKKTVIYSLRVAGTLDNSATPPDPWESWVQDVVDAADRADAAAALLENPGAQAETLEAGASATAAYADGVFTFGIPRGAKGDPGQDGKDGKDGKDGTNGTNGRDGTDGHDGRDGTNGQDGFSPSASVSKSGDTATITITDKDGTTSATVKDGQSYTPAQWELIKSGSKTNESSASFEITTDDNGNPFELTDLLFVLVTPQQETQAELGSYGRIYFYFDTNSYETAYVGTYTQAPNSAAKTSSAIITQENGLRRMGYFKNTTTGGDGSELTHANNAPAGNTDGLLVCAERTYTKVVIGAILGAFTYKLYGKRKGA